MTRVTATEFKNNIGAFSDAAMREPVIITNRDRDRLVLLSAEEYHRLTGGDLGLSPAFKKRVRESLERHSATLTDLSKR